MLALLIRAFAELWKKVNNALPLAPGLDPGVVLPPGPPQPQTTRVSVVSANPLAGLPLRYLIGADDPGPGKNGEVAEVGYDAVKPTTRGISIKYCNPFDEKNSGQFGPYLHSSDTAKQYSEGQIDPAGPGWVHNLGAQFQRAKDQGFRFVELDNPDAYALRDVLGAIDMAGRYGLGVIAKNALLVTGDATPYLAHPNVYGVIVERGGGSPLDMNMLRVKAGKPELPVWFVAFRNGNEDGRAWAGNTASAARRFKNMGVTYSPDGEYLSAVDLLLPNAGLVAQPPAQPTVTAALVPSTDFAARIGAAMQARGYAIAVGPDVLNIVYIEGADAPDGKPNANRPNAFDSLRILLRVLPDGSSKIIGMWEAITHAGAYYEHHKLNPDGAFHIALGQQACWVMGHYHDMEALTQEADIIGTRDHDEDFKRKGPTVKGQFGVHHHWGYDFPRDDVNKSSAGCQVGRAKDGHREFIALLKTDARYKADRHFMWSSTVMPVEWVTLDRRSPPSGEGGWPAPNPNYPSRGI